MRLLKVHGEVDLLTLPTVESALTKAVTRASRYLMVDLAAMSFCCARGFGLLADTHQVAATRGTAFALSGVTRHHRRALTAVAAQPNHDLMLATAPS